MHSPPLREPAARKVSGQVGRASCRGRGWISGVAVSLKKKKMSYRAGDGTPAAHPMAARPIENAQSPRPDDAREFERVAWSMARSWAELFFFQAEDGIRDYKVTGVQTCALPI